jgi:type II secretion system protein E
MSDVSLPVDTIRDQINGAIDVIVQLERDATGARRVSEISEVTSERREAYVTQPIMRSLAGAPNAEKNAVARFPLSERLEHRLTQKQEQVVPAFLGNVGGAQ